MSAVAIACATGAAVPRASSYDAALHGSDCDVAVAFSADQLRHIDVVPLLHDLVRRMQGSAAGDPKLFLVLSELVTNALDHGLLRLDSAIKGEPEGFQQYAALRQERLAALPAGRIEVRIASMLREGRPMLSIAVKDTGRGFDHVQVLQSRPDATMPFGRGIPLVKRMCEAVEYHGCGNAVDVVFAAAASEIARANPAAR
jgi:anti-sigma regulatory factor (Ser/Thr protein kinase)